MPLFNRKLDAKFQLSILQFKAKEHEQRAGIFLLCQSHFTKSITWKQHKDIALWCGVKGTQPKERKGVKEEIILYTSCIYLRDVYDLNNF